MCLAHGTPPLNIFQWPLCSLVVYVLGSPVMKHIPQHLILCMADLSCSGVFSQANCIIYFGDFVFCLYSSFDFHMAGILIPLDSKHHFLKELFG